MINSGSKTVLILEYKFHRRLSRKIQDVKKLQKNHENIETFVDAHITYENKNYENTILCILYIIADLKI